MLLQRRQYSLLTTVASRLNTEYYEHEVEGGAFEVSSDHYYLQDYLQPHIDYITPGIKGSDITDRTSMKPLNKRGKNGMEIGEATCLTSTVSSCLDTGD